VGVVEHGHHLLLLFVGQQKHRQQQQQQMVIANLKKLMAIATLFLFKITF
jgi:hypothetical protein